MLQVDAFVNLIKEDAISQIHAGWSEGRSIPTRRTELPALPGNDAASASHP